MFEVMNNESKNSYKKFDFTAGMLKDSLTQERWENEKV